ncbi:MAG: T9SS type A sorting domain-containing protein [Flavobacteriales bacterium]|nr:T9SS type A sorting domain-containing protein [Flavobacteriales bacterium]
MSGATLDMDRHGNPNSAYAFSGSSSLIQVGSTLPSIDTNADEGLTISFWVKGTSLSTSNTDLFDLRSNDNSAIHVLLNNEGSGNVQYNNHNGPAGAGAGECYASDPFVLDEWFHVLVTVNYATETSTLYVNNEVACASNFQHPSLTNPHLNFGSRFDNGSNTCCFMIGSLDDFGIWYRVLSASEITGLYEINTSVSSGRNIPAIKAYPNPTKGSVRITNIPQGTATQLFDATGRSLPISAQRQGTGVILDLSSYPAGLYLVRAGDRSFTIVRE